MESTAERFSDLDLSILPFTVNMAARGSIDAAAGAFDAARLDSPVWQSWSLPVGSSPGVPMAFLTTVVLPALKSDWVEIDLGAEYEASTLLRITCELHVACCCGTDHNMHVVEHHSWLAGDDQALAGAFDHAAAMGRQWLGTDLDPDHLRRWAGLPARAQ